MASRREVADFLKAFNQRRQQVGWLNVVNRQKNREALIELGLTKSQAEEIILSLTPEDYCEGPLADKKGSGQVWVFGRVEEGQEIYIKLKLTTTEAPICLSFHPAEQTLQYPLKEKEGREWRRKK